jgi:hypothetical protein
VPESGGGAPSGGGPLSGGAPPSGGGLHGPQIPAVVPCPMMHVEPAQQSALIVQPPQVGTHFPPPKQTNCGVPPAGFGTHGSPLQQSALVEQAWPAATHMAPAHRGTPTLSCRHVSIVSQLPAQQSHDALQLIVFNLHTSPFGLHPVGLRHTPMVPPLVILQVTLPDPGPGSPADPQQSESFEHESPTTWQPLAGWQMSTSVGPYGAHRRLQHDPPHVGIVPPSNVPPQTVPSTMEQLAAPEGGWLQVP